MARIPLPPTLSFPGTLFFDDASAPGSPSPLTPNVASAPTLWTIGTLSQVADAQLADVAQVIEELIQQDLVGTTHTAKTETVDAQAGRPAFDIVLAVSGDTEVTIAVGAQAPFSIGKAASCAATIRGIPGHGTTFIPA